MKKKTHPMSKLKKSLVILILSIMFLVFDGIIYLYYYQESKLFKKSALSEDYHFDYKEPHREVFLQTDKNTKINALHFYVKKPKGVVLHFHGRGKNLSNNIGKLSRQFTSRGYDFFIIDYRGFGKSKGPLNEKGLYHDGNFCYEYLLNSYPEDKIIVYGRSLGTSIATYVASHHNPKTLVLESPYFSILDLAPKEAPYLPNFLVPMFLKYHFRTDKWITKVDSPIHIFHGTEDELIPYESSIRLINLIKEKKDVSLTPIEKGKHNYLRYNPKYQTTLDQILK